MCAENGKSENRTSLGYSVHMRYVLSPFEGTLHILWCFSPVVFPDLVGKYVSHFKLALLTMDFEGSEQRKKYFMFDFLKLAIRAFSIQDKFILYIKKCLRTVHIFLPRRSLCTGSFVSCTCHLSRMP